MGGGFWRMGVAFPQVSVSATCGSLHIEGKSVEVALLPCLPETLSLASLMEHSRLPLRSLLGLFGPLLMLSLELPLGIARRTFELPVTDKGVQKALTFAMEQYNKDTGDSTNYFKVLRFLKAVREMHDWNEHHLMVELVETKCKKRAGMIMTYENFQKCPPLPGNQKKPTCYLNVPDPKPLFFKMILAITICN